ncbi:MAG: peptidoglycan-binding domain-containing protein [Pseudomonadota bacterium]
MYAYKPDHTRVATKAKSRNALAATVLEAPALFAGAALSVVVMGSIFVNAVWFQPVQHPSPLFSPRAEVVAPIQTANAEEAIKNDQVVAAPASREVLREVQTALASRGYYQGELDGIYGSRSKAAITAFQRDHDLSQSGKPSVRLLTQILLSASAKPAEVPVPKVVKVAARPKATENASIAADTPDGLIAQIQMGLREYGYDDIVVDGRMGRQTATAIQRFQLDFGMKITGEPSSTVLKKLREVGAYQQG